MRREEADGGDRSPHDGFGVPRREHGEGGDADEAADEVELVGVEVAQPGECPGDAVAEARHHGGDGDEHNGEDHPTRRPRGVEAEEDEVTAGDADPHVQEAGEHDECGERRRRERRTARLGHGSPTGTRHRSRGSCRAARRWRSTPGTRRSPRASGSAPTRRTGSRRRRGRAGREDACPPDVRPPRAPDTTGRLAAAVVALRRVATVDADVTRHRSRRRSPGDRAARPHRPRRRHECRRRRGAVPPGARRRCRRRVRVAGVRRRSAPTPSPAPTSGSPPS